MDKDLKRALREVNADPANPVGWVRGVTVLNRAGADIPAGFSIFVHRFVLSYYDFDGQWQKIEDASLSREKLLQKLYEYISYNLFGDEIEEIEDMAEQNEETPEQIIGSGFGYINLDLYNLYNSYRSDPTHMPEQVVRNLLLLGGYNEPILRIFTEEID